VKDMHSKIRAITFLVLGIIFTVFNKQIIVGVRWPDKTIWNEVKKAGDFQGMAVIIMHLGWLCF
jgi:hypothetical protein